MPLHSIGIKHQIVKVGCVSWWLVSSPLAANQRGFIESKRHIHLPMQLLSGGSRTINAGPFCEGPKPFPTTKTTVTSRPAFPASILPVISLFLATQQWALAWGWIHSVDLFSWLLRLFAPWFNERLWIFYVIIFSATLHCGDSEMEKGINQLINPVLRILPIERNPRLWYLENPRIQES